MQISIEEVPLGIRRRVAQLLENIRGTDMDPTGGKAGLTGKVNAIYRPDIDGIAYYEFAIDLAGATKRNTIFLGERGVKTTDMPAKSGFIIASAKPHDHPVSHWSLDREPPANSWR